MAKDLNGAKREIPNLLGGFCLQSAVDLELPTLDFDRRPVQGERDDLRVHDADIGGLGFCIADQALRSEPRWLKDLRVEVPEENDAVATHLGIR